MAAWFQSNQLTTDGLRENFSRCKVNNFVVLRVKNQNLFPWNMRSFMHGIIKFSAFQLLPVFCFETIAITKCFWCETSKPINWLCFTCFAPVNNRWKGNDFFYSRVFRCQQNRRTAKTGSNEINVRICNLKLFPLHSSTKPRGSWSIISSTSRWGDFAKNKPPLSQVPRYRGKKPNILARLKIPSTLVCAPDMTVAHRIKLWRSEMFVSAEETHKRFLF